MPIWGFALCFLFVYTIWGLAFKKNKVQKKFISILENNLSSFLFNEIKSDIFQSHILNRFKIVFQKDKKENQI